MKFAKVNRETCIACGQCGEEAPDIFDYDDEGIAYVTLDNNNGNKSVPDELWEQLEDAYENCPTESIQISDQPFEKSKLI
ncbi:ferredoxin [Gracilibacillus orientalis]|uniref:Ferredoxin n=1 Tax=Gracilibacillus orientalis TaxID=334253 RepID=A0A1I4J193_9BACI|nr:ferredoxin [Gracilibacillus orientalis]SFL60339.1 ferredoxin [Gracilibacillus orientalis]